MCVIPAQIECNTLFTGMDPLSPSIPSDYSLPFYTNLNCYSDRSTCHQKRSQVIHTSLAPYAREFCWIKLPKSLSYPVLWGDWGPSFSEWSSGRVHSGKQRLIGLWRLRNLGQFNVLLLLLLYLNVLLHPKTDKGILLIMEATYKRKAYRTHTPNDTFELKFH